MSGVRYQPLSKSNRPPTCTRNALSLLSPTSPSSQESFNWKSPAGSWDSEAQLELSGSGPGKVGEAFSGESEPAANSSAAWPGKQAKTRQAEKTRRNRPRQGGFMAPESKFWQCGVIRIECRPILVNRCCL